MTTMINEPEDNNIDRLFRTSIDNVETEPSDRFWNKAYDGILKNESSVYQRKIMVWRGVSAVLAVAVACLIGYNVYTNGKVTDIEKQVAGIERNQLQTANNESGAFNTVANSINRNTNASNQQFPKATEIQNANANLDNSTVIAANNQQLIAAGKTTNKYSGQTPSPEEQIASLQNVIRFEQQAKQELSSSVVAYNKPDIASTNEAEQSVGMEDQKSDQKRVSNIIYLDERAPSDPITIPLQDKVDDEIVAMDVKDNTTVKPINVNMGSHSDAWVAKKTAKIFHRFSVSAFLAPSISNPIMSDNGSNTGISAKDVKAREQQQLAYTYGANIGYDILPRLTIQTGVSYRAYRFYVNPTQVYAKAGDFGGATYPVVTSSGTVNMPYISGYTPWGYDTVATAKGSAVRSYISVPLSLKYEFYDKHKFGLYVTAGGAVNLLAHNYVTIHCQNQWGEEDAYVYDIEGTNKVNFSYKLGIGAEFTLGRKFSLYAEPSYSGAITPTAKGTPINTYSCYFDFAAGIGYHF
jgi:hypothetical protein